nr:ribosomal L7Ae/L30e/S12e/Gadd45 family protein [Maliibacterium massiliense]
MSSLEDIKHAPRRVVGIKQVMRAMETGGVQAVYLAADADAAFRTRVQEACTRYAVPLHSIACMADLGRACGIAVDAAVAAALGAD